jgi:uroporphyrinogen-III decarboxylase
MNLSLTPQQIVKHLLQGMQSPRPLFLPIVFSLGAKIENVPLREFLSSPTKITNALRQIRTRVRSDGVACYFDPNLEAEALGATLQWQANDEPAKLRWSNPPEKGKLPEGLCSPEEAAKHSRVVVAMEVIQRLQSLLRDEPLLLAGVSGPFALAAKLLQRTEREAIRYDDLPDDAVELAAETITQIATKLVEAGAKAIFIREEILPVLNQQNAEAWATWLAPAFNIIRFYQAAPILQITNSRSFSENSAVISSQTWDCILCPTLATFADGVVSPCAHPIGSTQTGMAMPSEVFQSNESSAEHFRQSLHNIINEFHPAIITTATDVPATTDVKQLSRLWEEIHR